ncbi:F-box protein CPR1-like [Telopea speciosissima]|uniref:F-box protein CPR1-like n=1 Tax=Telopea speciosissima TaxID=54955 RepID=UPI001CC4BB61|nr:F-box protein CPR1-like [Telopea speciosissima]
MRKGRKVEAGATAAKASRSFILKKNELLPLLPQEVIIFNILVRLRADKLYKFRSVCRSWYNLINDPFFIQSHLENSTPGLIIKRYIVDRKPIYQTDFKEMKDRKNTKQDLKFGNIGEVIGSCNGLVLLKTKRKRLSVANLITKQILELPSATSDNLNFDRQCGFTYVSEIGIYKLVHLLLDDYTLKCEVLSLGCSGCNTWRCVNGSSLSLLSEDEKWQFHGSETVTINGIVYFVGVRHVQSSSVHIVSFDAGAEVFHMIRAPIHDFTICDSFIELGGVLSFVQATDRFIFDTFNVWILKDWLKGTWVKQHAISIRKPSILGGTLHRIDSSDFVQVLSSFSHGGRKIILFQIKSFSGILSHITYDLDLNQESKIQFDIRGHPSGFYTHVNSLISPKLL